jgi:hypothetical protein
LFALSNWWKIIPNLDNEQYDETLLSYLDKSIELAEDMFYDNPEGSKKQTEAAFFLAISYGIRGELLAYRKNWTRATFAGKKAIKYMNYAHEKGYLSPEMLFGDGVYNYYSVWIPENYPMLKPVLIFFRKGNKQLGIKKLEEACKEAFYARVEAQYMLMRIYLVEENKYDKAAQIASYLHYSFPDNPYFHRYYARSLYMNGQYNELETTAKSMMNKLDSGFTGYDAATGRYAAYFLGEIYKNRYFDFANAKIYYLRMIKYTEELKNYESGYYHYALTCVAKIAIQEKQTEKAIEYYAKVLKYAERKSPYYREAEQHKQANKALWRETIKKEKKGWWK